jgi:hypothetical protein
MDAERVDRVDVDRRLRRLDWMEDFLKFVEDITSCPDPPACVAGTFSPLGDGKNGGGG